MAEKQVFPLGLDSGTIGYERKELGKGDLYMRRYVMSA